MQTLARMTRSLQEATPDAKDEVVAIGNLVADTDRLFGSPDALGKHPIDPRFTVQEVMNEARYDVGR